MGQNTRRILDMLAEGKITADEAERLLAALEAGDGPRDGGRDTSGPGSGKPTPRYLKMVAGNDEEHFQMKVPLSLLRAGVKIGAMMPEEKKQRVLDSLRAKGIEADPFNMSASQIDEFLQALGDLEIDAGDDKDHFRLYVE